MLLSASPLSAAPLSSQNVSSADLSAALGGILSTVSLGNIVANTAIAISITGNVTSTGYGSVIGINSISITGVSAIGSYGRNLAEEITIVGGWEQAGYSTGTYSLTSYQIATIDITGNAAIGVTGITNLLGFVNPTGNVSTTAINSLTASAAITIPLTGNSSTISVNGITFFQVSVQPLTSSAIATALNSFTASMVASTGITGVATTGTLGNYSAVFNGVSVPVTGNQINFSLNSITTSMVVSTALTGNVSNVLVNGETYTRSYVMGGLSSTLNLGNLGFTVAASQALTGNQLFGSIAGLGGTNVSITGVSSTARANAAAFMVVQYSDSAGADVSSFMPDLLAYNQQVVKSYGLTYTVDANIGTQIVEVSETAPSATYIVYLPSTLSNITGVKTNTDGKFPFTFDKNKFTVTYTSRTYYDCNIKYVKAGKTISIDDSYVAPESADMYKYSMGDERLFVVFTLTGTEYDEYGVPSTMNRKLSINIQPDYSVGRDAIQNIIRMRK